MITELDTKHGNYDSNRMEIEIVDGETTIIKVTLPDGSFVYVNTDGETTFSVDVNRESGENIQFGDFDLQL